MSSYNFYPQNVVLRKGQRDQTRPQFMNEYLVGYKDFFAVIKMAWRGRREKYMNGLDREKTTWTGLPAEKNDTNG